MHAKRPAAPVPPDSEGFQHLRLRLLCPFTHRDQRLRTRGSRRTGQPQDAGQPMAAALRAPVIRDPGQEFQDPRQHRRRGIAQTRGQDIDSGGISGIRHGRLARQRGLPGQADVDSHLT
jgi:hypothetical protein